MLNKKSQNDDLTPNQEYLVAFLVIGLFALMYWFFMHDKDIGFEGKSVASPTQVSSVTPESVASTNDFNKKPSKDDEVQARRDAAIVAEANKAKEAEGAKLLSDASMSEESLRSLLSEQNVQLVIEKKAKEEALRKLELAQLDLNVTKNESLKLTEIEKDKAFQATQAMAAAKKLANEERLKVEETTLKLTALEMQAEQQNALNANKVASLSESAEAERNAIAQKLEESKQLIEDERLKAEAAALKLTELERSKEELAALSASKEAILADTVKAERIKAEGIAQKLEDAKEAERVKTEELSKQLAEATEATRIKTEELTQQLADATEAERVKTEELSKQLAAAKQAAEAERIKADEMTLKLEEAKKLAESQRIKSEETLAMLAAYKEQKLKQEELDANNAARLLASVEAGRSKMEQQLDEVKRAKLEQETLQAEKENRELDEKIKAAQLAIQQQENNRLTFALASGKEIQIAPDGFENTLKNSIINNDTTKAMILDKVLFSSGSAALNNESIKQIEGAASILQAYTDSKVLLRGHTDNTGDETRNMALSFRRSMSIKKELVSLGISPVRIGVEGLGSQSPVADNSTKSGRRENRRIDLLLLDK